MFDERKLEAMARKEWADLNQPESTFPGFNTIRESVQKTIDQSNAVSQHVFESSQEYANRMQALKTEAEAKGATFEAKPIAWHSATTWSGHQHNAVSHAEAVKASIRAGLRPHTRIGKLVAAENAKKEAARVEAEEARKAAFETAQAEKQAAFKQIALAEFTRLGGSVAEFEIAFPGIWAKHLENAAAQSLAAQAQERQNLRSHYHALA